MAFSATALLSHTTLLRFTEHSLELSLFKAVAFNPLAAGRIRPVESFFVTRKFVFNKLFNFQITVAEYLFIFYHNKLKLKY
jgi:hypothetical protein